MSNFIFASGFVLLTNGLYAVAGATLDDGALKTLSWYLTIAFLIDIWRVGYATKND